MDSSCSTYRVGKVQSIFSLPVSKKLFRYSVVPLFRIPRFTNSPSFTLYTVHVAASFIRLRKFKTESALPALNLQRKVHFLL